MAAASRRPLTLPEELEKIEQQITLTLQEIDHNFNKAHRIVTSSIIPVVERFGTQSQAVWEGSKFWKQFFEASANVSLTKYEEEPTGYTDDGDGGEQTTQIGDETTGRNDTQYSEAGGRGGGGEEGSYLGEDSVTADVQRRRNQSGMQLHSEDEDEGDDDGGLGDVTNDSLLASLHLDQSTPKIRKPQPGKWANVDSPFEKMKKGLNAAGSSAGVGTGAAGKSAYHSDDDFSLGSSPEQPPTLRSNLALGQQPPTTPRPGRGTAGSRRNQPPPSSSFPLDSPFYKPPPARGGDTTQNQDPLLHRILDKNWRIQATPRGKPPPSRYKNTTTPRRPGGLFSAQKGGTGKYGNDDDDDDFLSSPTFDSPPPPPDLQTQILDTPMINRRGAAPSQTTQQRVPQSTGTTLSTRRLGGASGPPRTPSRNPHRTPRPTRLQPPVLDPVSTKKLKGLGDYYPTSTTRSGRPTYPLPGNHDDDDEEDELLLSPPPAFSPPVTIQFSLPQRQILATPAREASRRLVRDILRTAGADDSANTSGSFAAEDEGDGGRYGYRGGGYAQGGHAEEEEEEDDEYELDLGEYGSGAGGASGSGSGAMASWRNQGGGGGAGRMGLQLENSPTIVRGRGMDLGDETF